MNRITIRVSKELRAIPGVRNLGSHIGRAEVADTVRDALDAVSAELTTERVTEMLRQTDVEQRNPEDVAAEFLEQAGL